MGSLVLTEVFCVSRYLKFSVPLSSFTSVRCFGLY